MKRQLLLLRHGKSDWSRPVDDLHRPLKKRGRKAAARMGCWLRRERREPELIISSPAIRALETARIVAGVLGRAEDEIVCVPGIYEAHWRDLLTIARALPRERNRFLLVGQHTSMEELVLFLAAGRVAPAANGKLMPTAALALFFFSGSWKGLKPGRIREARVIRPRELAGN
jgi:phosphohistidine phosphatase